MPFKLKHFGELFKTSFKAWNAKDPFRQSAVIAYYAIFSLPALLVLIISVAGFFFGREAVNQHVMAQISDTMGAETSNQIKEMLVKAAASRSSVWAAAIGIIVLIVGATGVFVELQKSLNIIWEVKVVPSKGIWLFLKTRLFSFGLILAIAFLLLVSLVISTALAAVSNWAKADSSMVMVLVIHVLDFIISLAVISTLFALIFKILPDAKIDWKYVIIGSIVTGLLFIIGKTAIAFYFGKASPASGYGAAGSIVLILLWVSYSSMILFFGAEFTRAYADRYKGTVHPTELAKKEPLPQNAKSL
jgi:membrane protein